MFVRICLLLGFHATLGALANLVYVWNGSGGSLRNAVCYAFVAASALWTGILVKLRSGWWLMLPSILTLIAGYLWTFSRYNEPNLWLAVPATLWGLYIIGFSIWKDYGPHTQQTSDIISSPQEKG